ncbi:MAG TPA: LysR family transcriptional regulator [Albidovulum sp.]|uniref:LysR family transcriptional regulator n=1 Tax=Albidovulum sp. TaxID=1872424 RepID=UPI002CD57437|nr:LysR family transcriptional regulator [Albidovulum sp.]
MIDRLEMFIALANERHFGRAAEAMGVTQPSLSSAIRQLENQLGVQLVFRGSRFQGLTPEGQRVLDWALKIVGDARTLREEMRARKKGLSGKLRIGVIPTALPVTARLTAPFLERNPNVDLTILSRTSIEILDGIDRLELDAGLTYLDNEPLGRVTQVPLYRESYRLLVASTRPEARFPAISWAEAAGLPLCLLTGDMQNRRIINQHLSEAGADVRARVESNSSIVLITHVSTGRWVSIVAEALADMHTAGTGLTAVPIEGQNAHHTVGIIAAFREPHTPVLAALIDEARRVAWM